MSIQLARPGSTRIGWIGTGVMGRWMCEHAMKKGFTATVYNRSKDKAQPLVDLGAKFGATPKAQRVIPNKVFQALACGKPLVTCSAPAYPEALRASAQSGLIWVPPGDPEQLAQAVRDLAQRPGALASHGAAALATHHRFFSEQQIREQLAVALAAVTAGY